MNRKALLGLVCASILPVACSIGGKLDKISRDSSRAVLSLPFEESTEFRGNAYADVDTMVADSPQPGEDGIIIMNAVKDDNGEMVATDVISAAVVSARFRNVAERHGKVDLRFRITVPGEMQDSKWQLRFYPEMFVLDDTLSLDPVVITGYAYRKAQLRGYQQYQRFLDSILQNDSLMINMNQLEIFLKRNLSDIYAFKADTSYVSDEMFMSRYGVTEREAVEHYTNKLLRWNNERKISMKDRMFRRYVKVPIVSEGLRLDTVMRAGGGEFIYDYVQTLYARPKLRKAEIGLSGDIFEQDKKIYNIPASSPLTFYISSLSTLADDSDKYVSRIIERRVEANTACYICFASGKSDIDRSLGENSSEIARIEQNLSSLARNEEFDLDSIVVTASASPEGSYQSNLSLTTRRSKSVVSFFRNYLRGVMDSLSMQRAYVLGADPDEIKPVKTVRKDDITFISRADPENWRMLDAIIRSDVTLSEKDKESYYSLAHIEDLDRRENAMRQLPCYLYLRQSLYPRLRTVKFDFYLHRKGMEKDTVHTTVLDTAYMRGVQAIKDRDYRTAVTILRPYHDYNTAVAFCSMDYNASALDILKDLDRTPQVEYLLAVVYSRMGRIREAMECYYHTCEVDQSFVHRGNLDPEISELKRRYESLRK